MALSLMPGETVLHQASGKHKGTNYGFYVTNRRLVSEESRWGSGSTTYLPLDKVDSMQEARVSSMRWLVAAVILVLASLVGVNAAGQYALLALVPALICAGIWYLSLKQALVFATSSSQVSLVLGGHSRGQEVLEVAESARQDCIREVYLPASAPPAPVPSAPAPPAPDPSTPPSVTLSE